MKGDKNMTELGKLEGFSKEELPEITGIEIEKAIERAKSEGEIEKKSAEASDIALEQEVEVAIKKATSENFEKRVNLEEFARQKAEALFKEIKKMSSAAPFRVEKIQKAIFAEMEGITDIHTAEKVFNEQVKEELRNQGIIPDYI